MIEVVYNKNEILNLKLNICLNKVEINFVLDSKG